MSGVIFGPGDGAPPDCMVVLCSRPASFRTTDADGRDVYVCEPHRPFARMMARPRNYNPPPGSEVVVPVEHVNVFGEDPA